MKTTTSLQTIGITSYRTPSPRIFDLSIEVLAVYPLVENLVVEVEDNETVTKADVNPTPTRNHLRVNTTDAALLVIMLIHITSSLSLDKLCPISICI